MKRRAFTFMAVLASLAVAVGLAGRTRPRGGGRPGVAHAAAIGEYARGEVVSVDVERGALVMREGFDRERPPLEVSVDPEKTRIVRGESVLTLADIQPGDFATVHLSRTGLEATPPRRVALEIMLASSD